MSSFSYLGSKRSIASSLVKAISKTLDLDDGSLFRGSKQVKRFYEPFGGSGSFSLEALHTFKGVECYYSDSSYVVDFLRLCRGEIEWQDWMDHVPTREEFLEANAQNSFQEWWTRHFYSFGNTMGIYCFSKPGDREAFLKDHLVPVKPISPRRVYERLRRQETFKNFHIERCDYNSISIEPEGSIVYLDPPYINLTSNLAKSCTYSGAKPFSLESFTKWATKLEVPAFTSELTNQLGWEEVLSIKKKRCLGRKAEAEEKLFWNGIKL